MEIKIQLTMEEVFDIACPDCHKRLMDKAVENATAGDNSIRAALESKWGKGNANGHKPVADAAL